MLLTMLPFHAWKKVDQENVVQLRQEIDLCYRKGRSLHHFKAAAKPNKAILTTPR